jgi:HD domain
MPPELPRKPRLIWWWQAFGKDQTNHFANPEYVIDRIGGEYGIRIGPPPEPIVQGPVRDLAMQLLEAFDCNRYLHPGADQLTRIVYDEDEPPARPSDEDVVQCVFRLMAVLPTDPVKEEWIEAILPYEAIRPQADEPLNGLDRVPAPLREPYERAIRDGNFAQAYQLLNIDDPRLVLRVHCQLFLQVFPRSTGAPKTVSGTNPVSDKAQVDRIKASSHWQQAADWGQERPGHPEGTIGRHVEEQVLPFIDLHYRDLADYWSLVALAYLHDIGKPSVDFRHGVFVGNSHSVLSARIAEELGAPDRLVRVILLNDRAYSHWRRLLDNKGRWTAARWTEEHREAFVREFSPGWVDLPLLVRFHRADNGYRRAPTLDESVDPVFWFENRLLEERLLDVLPQEGKDRRFEWNEAG